MHFHSKNLPQKFLQRLEKIYSNTILKTVLESFETQKMHTFRINTLKTSQEQIEKELIQQNIIYTKDTDLENCYFFAKDFSLKNIQNLQIYQEGLIYLQNFSSQIPALILNPQPKEWILDACASPGSKTTQMASLSHNQAKIVALEPNKIRFERLQKNILQQNAVVECLHTRLQDYKSKQKFDKILVDAPCSGEGTFDVIHPQTYKHWNMNFIKKISQTQRDILYRAFDLLKKNGELVYSTCSLSPEENEYVIHDFLNFYSNAKLLPLKLFNKKKEPGWLLHSLCSWEGRDMSLENCRRIAPDMIREGFFVCKIKKI